MAHPNNQKTNSKKKKTSAYADNTKNNKPYIYT